MVQVTIFEQEGGGLIINIINDRTGVHLIFVLTDINWVHIISFTFVLNIKVTYEVN